MEENKEYTEEFDIKAEEQASKEYTKGKDNLTPEEVLFYFNIASEIGYNRTSYIQDNTSKRANRLLNSLVKKGYLEYAGINEYEKAEFEFIFGMRAYLLRKDEIIMKLEEAAQ